MLSHTVPKKLLEQFAYDDPRTKSKRLWQYHKGFPPWWKASPGRATAWDGHFRHPENATKEEELEFRLKQEFEDPVNQFIETIGDPSFTWTPEKIRLLTGYMRMLFNRTPSRRAASEINAKAKTDGIRVLLKDDRKIDFLTKRMLADVIENGLSLPRPPWSPRLAVKDALRKQIVQHSGPEEPQRDYIQAIELMMTFPDETMLNGDWTVIYTVPEEPFVIGDAPVVTWERVPNDIRFGIGFAQPNVEVFLPVSPTACICVLPRVARTRPFQPPTMAEVNSAQARFATQHCFSNLYSLELDAILQPHFGKMRMGIDGFSVDHLDASEMLFGVLMNPKREVVQGW
jgi:Protein of unknown function (DUF4238)